MELFGRGEKQLTDRATRLRLASNCSLHITNVSTNDVGLYVCQQYLKEGGLQHGSDVPVHLTVVHGR